MARVYIGNLGVDCRESDIEKLFKDYGRITDIHLKGVYGFLNFDDKRDASDAIKEVNGRSFNGGRIRVDYAKEPRFGGGGGRDRFDRGGRGSDRRSFDRPRGSSRNAPGKWTNYRLLVENLSSKTSWQDLKDYMREAGDITYTKAHSPRSGDGVVEFADRDGMEYALRKLDDTELDGRRIKLTEEGGGRGRSRSRSRSRSGGRRSRSRSRSTERRKRSRSRSRSNRSKEKSKSPAARTRSPAARSPAASPRPRVRSNERRERSSSRSSRGSGKE